MRIRLNHARLLEALAGSKLSQNHWAIRLGLSRGHWSGIVKGKHPYPSRKTRERLLEVLGLSFDDLFTQEADAGVDADFQAAIADRYLIDREVAHGGMGIVYLARDIRLARPVALKLVSSEAVAGIGMGQLLKEIRFTARLQHHHILPIYDAGEAAGTGFYVMPFLRQGSLRDRLTRDGALSVEETVQLVRGMTAGLQHAHDRQVLHCDVKPENVLLSDAHAYMADFGIARAIHAEAHEWASRRELDTSAGTPAYVSPEQAAGERQLDARSDVYSLACVMFEMLAGQAPFGGRTTMEVVARRFSASPSLRLMAPQVPEPIAAVITRAMSVREDERPASAAQFQQEITTATTRPRVWIADRVGRAAGAVVRGSRAVVGRGGTGGGGWGAATWRDLQYAARSLWRTPSFAIPSILTLALGIAANSAAFAVLSGLLLRPLPYPNADRLAMAWSVTRDGSVLDTTTVSPADYLDWRETSTQFVDLAGFNIWTPIVSGDRTAEQINAGVATSNFFSLMGIEPFLGRTFTGEEGTAGQDRVAVLSHGFWQRWLGGDSDVLDRTITLNGDAYDIVGVMPESYRHIDPSARFGDAQLWVPVAYTPGAGRSSRFLRVVGRLRLDATVQDADAEIAGLARQLESAFPGTNRDREAVVVSLRDQHYAAVRPALLLVQAAAGFVLLLVCANVANLLLARGQARRREFALRRSLGAGHRRLIRQLIVENTLLAAAGGMVGLGSAFLLTGVLRSTQDALLSPIAEVGVDFRVVALVVLVSLIVGLAFGLLGAWDTARSEVRDVLSDDAGGIGSGRRSSRFRSGLIVAEVAVTVMLLIQAGLLTRSFVRLMSVPPGFDVEQVLTFETGAPRAEYATADQFRDFFQTLEAELTTIPGVTDVGLVSDLPFTTENRSRRFNPASDPHPAGEEPEVEYHTVGPSFFQAMRIPVRSGRTFTDADRAETRPVVVVNEEMVRRYWSDTEPIGQLLQPAFPAGAPPLTVIGVVGDIVDDGFNGRAEPRVYYSYVQSPVRRMAVVVRTTVEPASLVAAVRSRVRALEPEAPVSEVWTLEQMAAATLSGERTAMRLAGGFSLLAILLAGTGIYGLLAYVVAARRREIGIRAALGAHGREIVQLVLRRSVGLTVLGAVLGVGAGVIVARTTATLLFGVVPLDPWSLVAAPVLLMIIALVASYVPARRALRIHPAEALRGE